MINGIQCRSSIEDLTAGTIKDYDPNTMSEKLMKSILMQMTPEELRTLPPAPINMKPTLAVSITPSGKMEWRDL